jgi:hypothetical protein
MFFFARRLHIGHLASTITSISYYLSGVFFVYGNNHFARIYAIVPIAFFAVQLINEKINVQRIAFLAFSIYWIIGVGMPESSFFAIVLLSLYAVFLSAIRVNSKIQSLYWQASGFLIGSLLAAPLLLPMAELIKNSHHTHKSDSGSGLSLEPKSALVGWISPFIQGKPFSEFASGGFTGVRSWVGISVTFFALCAIFSYKTKYRATITFMAITTTAMLVYCYSFIGGKWIHNLPGFNISLPAWGVPLIAFPVAVLAGIGIQNVLSGSRQFGYFTVSAFAMLTLFVFFSHLNSSFNVSVPLSHLRQWIQFPILFISSVAIVAVLPKFKRQKVLLSAVILLGVTTELVGYAHQNKFAQRSDPYLSSKWLMELKTQKDFRPESRVMGFTAKMMPSTSAAYGIRDIRQLDALYVDRYWEYIKTFIQPGIQTRFVGGPYSALEESLPAYIANNPMFDLTGVQYFVAGSRPKHEIYFPSLTDDLIRSIEKSDKLRDVCAIILGGVEHCGLLAHAPSSLTLPINQLEEGSLQIAFGLDQMAYAQGASDGVAFIVRVELSDGSSKLLYRKDVVPSDFTSPSRWYTSSINISKDLAPSIKRIVLETDPLGDTATDWSYWGPIQFLEMGRQPFELKVNRPDESTAVYKTNNPVNRALLVESAVVVKDRAGARDWLKGNSLVRKDGSFDVKFNPFSKAILEDQKLKSFDSQCKDPGDVKLLADKGTKLLFEVDAKCQKILLINNIFYPGWKAKIDGRQTKIYAADLAFQSVVIPSGTSLVEVSYEPLSLNIGLIISLTMIFLLLIWVIISLRRSLKLWRH